MKLQGRYFSGSCPPENPDALFSRSHRACRSLGYPRPFGLNSSQEFNPIRGQDVMSLISTQCEQVDELKQRQLKLGLDVFQAIERDDDELSRWLRDAFDGDEQVIATWLTSYMRALGTSPLERLANGGRKSVIQIFGSIIHGLCA